MASSGRLGLGSRANASPFIAQQFSPIKAATTTMTTPSNHTPKKRRGFGLFDNEDEFDTDFVEPQQKEPVQFSGDLSGFASMSDSEGPSLRSPTKSSSRTSSLTTPKRRSAVSSRRSTPYTTTNRALMRAKRGNKEPSENEEEKLISESMFGTSLAASGTKSKARFVMSGALGYSEDEQQSTEPDTDPELYKTPVRELFTRKPKSPAQRSVDSNQQIEGNNVAKKTWGQWLKSILPDVVVKPVVSIIHTPQSEKLERSQPSTPFMTPEQEYRDSVLAIPGSFEKDVCPPTDNNCINPNFLNNDTQWTPIRSSEGLFNYNSQSPFINSPASTQSNTSQSPASTKKGSRAPSAPTSARRMASTPPAISYRKPSNFIERMRNAKKQKRYDPYSRPSSSPRKVGGTFTPQPHEEISPDLTPEEELEHLERREKDRKVQEAEDRYLRRETLRRLGRPIEDEEMSDSAGVPSKKGKERADTVEDSQDMDDGMEGDRSGSTTPPDSPPQQTASIFRPTGAPLFQFQNIAPKPAPTTEKAAPADHPPADKDKPVFSFSSATSFGEADSDKENISQPLPPPVISHQELLSSPVPLPSATANGVGLFAERQSSGSFDISEAPVAQPVSAFSPLRQRFDKFKPRVSSSLRESATVEKENEHDKENPSGTINNGEGSSSAFGKSGKAAFGTQVVPKQPSQVGSSGALREVARNSPVGTGIKIDVRAKIAALPVKDLSSIAAWPINLEVITAGSDQKMPEYVRTAFTASSEDWLKEWAVNDVFGAARASIDRI